MGGMFKTKIPGKSPEQIQAEEAERARLAEEKKQETFAKAEEQRKFAGNLYGQQSLQDEDMQGFQGFRTTKTMGRYR
tara:strand:- start:177 stop:407 length:231 start_codon:yes stop_codon:yes gene_type:complete